MDRASINFLLFSHPWHITCFMFCTFHAVVTNVDLYRIEILILAHSQRHAVPLVPANLGQGKDYFDEMFKDLTRETLYTQTRPKSSPTECQPIEPEPEMSKEKAPSPRAESPVERPPSIRPASERPPSSVYHDYNTTTSR